MYARVGEKRSIDDIDIEDEEAIGSLCRLSGRTHKSAMEQEKKIRREIANSNERRRMQSINAGFASLKTLLPHHEGEKLSKAAILQQTAEYVYQLEQEKTRLLSQNSQLKRLLNQQHVSDQEGSPTGPDSPPEERTTLTVTPPPSSAPLNTQISVPVSNHLVEESMPENVAKKVYLPMDRKQKPEEQHLEAEVYSIRGMESNVYVQSANKSPQHVKMDYQPKNKRVKIEVKHEEIQTYSHDVAELSPVSVEQQQETYAQVLHEIQVAKPSNLMPSKASNRMFPSILKHPGTIVTVMPSKAPVKPSLLDLNELSASITSENTTDEGGNHTVFIVNSSSSLSCQKSLDTICEAIRHLEGDHMFPPEDHMFPPEDQHPIRIEEEVVTEETYTVEEDHHSTGHNRSMSPLTLHMIEPQEVPLELTTSNHNRDMQQYTFTQRVPAPTLMRHTTRPGVIVVKQS